MSWFNLSFKNTKEKGNYFEQLAQAHLVQHGLSPITQNYLCRYGEIDLIMKDAQTLVFVEVKYRKNNKFGGALHALTKHKQQCLRNSIHYYLQQHHLENQSVRVDFVAINGHNPYHVDWFQSVF